MRSDRLRAGALARLANNILDLRSRTDMRPMVLGFGNGDFAAASRGSKAAPVTAFAKAINAAVQRRAHAIETNRVGPVMLTLIDEYHTSKMCCSTNCGNKELKKVKIRCPKKNGNTRASTRLLFCPGCHPATSESERKKLAVDRDENAAMNMLNLTIRKFYGLRRKKPFIRPGADGSDFDWQSEFEFFGCPPLYCSCISVFVISAFSAHLVGPTRLLTSLHD